MRRYIAAPATAPEISLRPIPKGYRGTMHTAEQVKRLIREGARDFYVRQRAIDILLARGVRPKNYLGEINALFQWVQRNIRYTRDPFRVEVLHSPRRMLELQAGDCDDMTILLGSMLESIGHPVRLVITGPNPLKPRLFSHIYLEVHHYGRWIPLDATMPHPMGWSPRTLVKQVIAIQEEPKHAIRGHGTAGPGRPPTGAGLAPGTHPGNPSRRRETQRPPVAPALDPAPKPGPAQPEPMAQGPAALHLEQGARRPGTTDRHPAAEAAASELGDSAPGRGAESGRDGTRCHSPAPVQTAPPAAPGESPARGPGSAGGSGTPLALSGYVRQGEALYRQFNRFDPRCLVRERHSRIIPPVVVQLGDLVGLIYRSDKWLPGRPRTYIHFMANPPRLVTDVGGRRLFVVGGSYRVTTRGIEG